MRRTRSGYTKTKAHPTPQSGERELTPAARESKGSSKDLLVPRNVVRKGMNVEDKVVMELFSRTSASRSEIVFVSQRKGTHLNVAQYLLLPNPLLDRT